MARVVDPEVNKLLMDEYNRLRGRTHREGQAYGPKYDGPFLEEPAPYQAPYRRVFVFVDELKPLMKWFTKPLEAVQRTTASKFGAFDPKLGVLLGKVADATRDVREYLLTKLEDGRPGT